MRIKYLNNSPIITVRGINFNIEIITDIFFSENKLLWITSGKKYIKLSKDREIIENNIVNPNMKKKDDFINKILLGLVLTEIKGKNIEVIIEDIKALINNVNLKLMLTKGISSKLLKEVNKIEIKMNELIKNKLKDIVNNLEK